MPGSGGFQVRAQDLPAGSHELRVAVYDRARLPHQVLMEASEQLRTILRKAGATVDIVLGNPGDEDASLFTYVALPPGRERQAACDARRDIALTIIGASPPSLPATVLGMSSPFARTGLNVRLFNDHIREAADSHGAPYVMVLSYAMAHEIGHVLLRSSRHSSWGLMSSIWTAHEYALMDRGGLLFFTGEEAAKIVANLGGRGCPNVERGPAWAGKSR